MSDSTNMEDLFNDLDERIEKFDRFLEMLTNDFYDEKTQVIKKEDIDLFADKISSLKNLPDDYKIKQVQSGTIKKLNAKRLELIVMLRKFAQNAQFAFSNEPITLKLFVDPTMDKMAHMDLLKFARDVRFATDENFFAMSQFGMSRSMRDKLSELNKEFYDSLKDRMNAAKLSGSVKTDRAQKLMELENDFNTLKQKVIYLLEMKLEEYQSFTIKSFMSQFSAE